MSPLEVLFYVCKKFTTINPEQFSQIQNEGLEWESKLKSDSDNKLEAFYAKYSRKWFSRLLCALSTIYFTKKIPQWMAPDKDDDENED